MSELLADLEACKAEITRLRSAVQTHYDQRGDSRCHLDDLKLYHDALGIEPDPFVTALPPCPDMIESCHRYIRQRQCPEVAGTYPMPGDMTIAQLTDAVARLQSERDEARDLLRQCWDASGLLCENWTGKPGQSWEVPSDLVGQIEDLASRPESTEIDDLEGICDNLTAERDEARRRFEVLLDAAISSTGDRWTYRIGPHWPWEWFDSKALATAAMLKAVGLAEVVNERWPDLIAMRKTEEGGNTGDR